MRDRRPRVLPRARPHSETGRRWPTPTTSGRPPKATVAARPASSSNRRLRSSTSSASCIVRRPCLNNMGVRAYYEGSWDDALDLYHRSEEVVRRAGDVLTGGHATNNRAEILLDQGRLDEAAELFDVALRTYRAAKFPVGEALVMINLGRLAAEKGRFAEAHRYLDDARAQLEALGAESYLIEADARRAQAFILEGRHADVVELATTALGRMRSSGELGVRSALLERLLGLAAVQARSPDEGRAAFRRKHPACAFAGRRVRARSHPARKGCDRLRLGRRKRERGGGDPRAARHRRPPEPCPCRRPG